MTPVPEASSGSPLRAVTIATLVALSITLPVAAVGCTASATPRGSPGSAGRPASDAATASAWAVPRSERPDVVASVVGLAAPASALHDPALDVWYVSNVAGEPGRKDGRGRVTRLSGDGARGFRVEGRWIESGRAGVTLHAPQGLALTGDTLWVADVDVLRGFDRRTGRPVAAVDLAPLGAVFLNDVAVGPDGVLYVTDSGRLASDGGPARRAGHGRLYRVAPGGRAGVALVHPGLAHPAGIAWDAPNRRFVIAPMDGDTILGWRPGDAAPQALAGGPGRYDGVVATRGGRLLVASRATNGVYELIDGRLVQVLGGQRGVADIAYDDARGWIAVPLSEQGRVAFYPAPPRRGSEAP
jgi:hypothetical protein